MVITDGSGPGAAWGPRVRILEQDRGSRSKAAGHGWSSGIDTERKAFSFVIQVTNGTGQSGSSPPRPFGVKPGRPLSFADQGRPRPRWGSLTALALARPPRPGPFIIAEDERRVASPAFKAADQKLSTVALRKGGRRRRRAWSGGVPQRSDSCCWLEPASRI